MQLDFTSYLNRQIWFKRGNGPRYKQLSEHIAQAIAKGLIPLGSRLPPEREVARLASVSRVTVRNAITELSNAGHVEQIRGSGSYVIEDTQEIHLKFALSSLSSFTESMELRGLKSSSVLLSQSIEFPSSDEMMALGISPRQKIARIRRLRSADDTPLAIETSSLPVDVLPQTENIKKSLYQALRDSGHAPVRAIQKMIATNLVQADSKLLALPVGTAVLNINRTAYLASGRPIELTQGIYRSDVYEFVAELNLDE